jgi:hypothetical protein
MFKVNRGGNIEFHKVNNESDAAKRLPEITQMKQVYDFLSKLAKEGKDETTYEIEQIDALLNMCKLATGVLPTDYAQKIWKITAFAAKEPSKFLSFYEGQTSMYRINIASAVELAVLDVKGKSALFANDKKEFYEFKKTTKEDRFDELVLHFLGEGASNYETLNILLETAKKLQLK